MGQAQSQEDLEICESDEEEYEQYEEGRDGEEEEDKFEDSRDDTLGGSSSGGRRRPKSPASLDDVDAQLRALKLKYASTQEAPSTQNSTRLFRYINGNTPKAKWVTAEKCTAYCFVKTSQGNEDEEDEDASGDSDKEWWVLKVGSKIREKVSDEMQLKAYNGQRRVDFVAKAVWALKFASSEDFTAFVSSYNNCLFENNYGVELNDASKAKIYGKDFIGWANPEVADDSMWEDADDILLNSPQSATPARDTQDLTEAFEEATSEGIHSLALGALDNSFLVGDSGIQVFKNMRQGIQGKGVCVNFEAGYDRAHSAPRKALLMRAETNMLLMSPMSQTPHSRGIHQLDIETGKVISEWKFEKDGVDISMSDITNDGKGAQLDPSASTFLGLDNNRLCRWDMRDRYGMVQDLATANTPVLNWAQGHQFSRGTNFQCFATTGDGSIVVGSLDGKIRLYSSNTMRQAKTAFPGLGAPVTHVDATFDGKWIVGTTDTYLIVICTLFTDKAGKTKTGFEGRMGNKIAAPRLLKLRPLDAHLAGSNNKFRNAQFSWVTENGKQERHVVATVGKFSVIWNFQQVKNGAHECYHDHQEGLKKCYCYKIVLRNESIVDSRFMNDNFAVSGSPEAPLVIATPMKVSSFSLSSKR
uniref:Protein CYPRO4 n=1 Tax=Noccaea caerulescens TaxID=107243 RepID=A0A1J3ITC1_NOCCA